jgi:hypothetical protein
MSHKARIEKLEAATTPPPTRWEKWKKYWSDLHKVYGLPGEEPEPVPDDPEAAINEAIDRVYGVSTNVNKKQD